MFEDEIIEKCGMKKLKCCSCGCKILPCSDLNVLVTTKSASWKCPIYGTFDDPNFPARAVAIVCDVCARASAKIIFCVEFQSNALVKYHTLEKLDEVNVAEIKMKHYFGKKFVLGLIDKKRIMLRAAQGGNKN